MDVNLPELAVEAMDKQLVQANGTPLMTIREAYDHPPYLRAKAFMFLPRTMGVQKLVHCCE